MLPIKKKPLKMVGSPSSTGVGGKDAETAGTREPDLGVPSHSQVTNTDDMESSETEEEVDNSLSNSKNRDSDWEPGSMYLKRRLQSDNRPDDIAYRLRSRRVGQDGKRKLISRELRKAAQLVIRFYCQRRHQTRVKLRQVIRTILEIG